ncbi:MAG: ATP synthase subunit I [Acidobacteria bacterium]|nr:ATP synthase subunit I [Acidobacteriota bacterium]
MASDEQFVDRALRRMYGWMAACAVLVALVLLIWKGAWHAGGFAIGAALSILNFHWLKSAVDGLAAHIGRQKPVRAGRLVAKWLLRYALIVATGYAILKSSVVSLSAFLGGLLVFVAGVLAEMIYELATGTGN